MVCCSRRTLLPGWEVYTVVQDRCRSLFRSQLPDKSSCALQRQLQCAHLTTDQCKLDTLHILYAYMQPSYSHSSTTQGIKLCSELYYNVLCLLYILYFSVQASLALEAPWCSCCKQLHQLPESPPPTPHSIMCLVGVCLVGSSGAHTLSPLLPKLLHPQLWKWCQLRCAKVCWVEEKAKQWLIGSMGAA